VAAILNVADRARAAAIGRMGIEAERRLLVASAVAECGCIAWCWACCPRFDRRSFTMRLAHLALGFVALKAVSAQDLIGMFKEVKDAGVMRRHRPGTWQQYEQRRLFAEAQAAAAALLERVGLPMRTYILVRLQAASSSAALSRGHSRCAQW
jgi:hypothetical protein